ncbi:DUF7373 family lipoprotein [Nocardia australiensis]|uniref:DUF7373 family lipoprotein n=1 Tax=Nocardia australiensis TaxID=2887191 RepID=UPI001D146FB8|nr:hypothetical protein [Nocardia australiensis]
MRFRYSLCIVVAAAIAMTTGCGDSDPDVTTPTIDVSKLDSGNFPTTPRDSEQVRTQYSGPALEAIRIGNASPLPIDVDSRFIFQRLRSTERRVMPGMRPYVYSLNEASEFDDLAEGFVAGWETNGERRRQAGLGTEMVLQSLRFSTAAQAETAARKIGDRQAQDTPGEPVTIPDFPQALAKWSISKKYLDSLLVHDTMLLLVHVTDPISEPVDTAPLIELTRKSFNKQVEMLKGYSPTPADQLGSLPIDADGLLARTLPIEEKDKYSGNFDPSMAAPKQATIHTEKYPNLAKAAFDDAGVDSVAIAGARLYRTQDSNSAIRLAAALSSQDTDNFKPMDSPPNMPGVKCIDRSDPKADTYYYPPACYITYDRYVAWVHGNNVQELYQKTAAQYKLLTYGR